MTSADSSYRATLTELSASLPTLAATLQRAEQQRERTAAALAGGARLKGVDELLRHLDELRHVFADDPALGRLAFLIQRGRADLETAAEATISGYVAVASDAMRDIMEIENLLLDFAVNPAHIDEWLAADQTTPKNKYWPRTVRARLHAAGEGAYAATAESVDYKAHSAALHVSPHRDPLAERGFSADQGWAGDAGFWEIFEHTRRLRRAIQRLTGVLAPDSRADKVAGQTLRDAEDAWRRTQQMQDIYLALLHAVVQAQKEQGEDS